MSAILTDAERSAMESAQLLVVVDTSKRAVEIGFLAARAFYGEGPRDLESEIEHARTEQEIENDAVRTMQRTGKCPTCGADS